MRILVVEDEAQLAQHISRTLIEAGHEPAMVHDGETALGEAVEKQYDLILLDVNCSEITQERAEGLLDRILYLSSVVDNLLLLSRADAGRLELSKAEFDLGEVLEGVLDDALTLAEPLDLKVEADVPKHLLLKADRTFVAIIAQNLVENAVKYNTPGGRIRIRARAVNGAVEITIGNTGDGIPKDRTGHLFERFYRVCRGERVPGHGLGPSTARELARAYGGDIELVRSDRDWTEMRVRLPQLA